MINITPTIRLHEDELRFQFKLASGPGGQNVNKVAAAELRFDVAASPSLPEAVRALTRSRATQNGELLITAQRFRSQERNRQGAIGWLIALIRKAAEPPKLRLKTRPSRAARERRRRRSGGSARKNR